MNITKFHFCGLGLIGGSIAKAIRKYYPQSIINVYARHPEKVASALSDGTANRITDRLSDIDPDTDVLFLCAPTGANIGNMKSIRQFLTEHENILITDVGSVKGDICRAAADLGLSSHFLGGHPMTGKETTGYDNSDPTLLENAYYILTPAEDTSKNLVADFTEIVSSIRAIPLAESPDYHDFATAAISHVPHLIAAALVKNVADSDNEVQFMRTIAAGGFKDITRIASSDPDMWENICRSNTENIRVLLRRYIDELERIDDTLECGDFKNINELFRESGTYRNSMPEKAKGALPPIYRIFVDIPDESGAIAGIATLLAAHNISIKNTGINNNREQYEGALYIEFYTAEAKALALPLLNNAGYRVTAEQ